MATKSKILQVLAAFLPVCVLLIWVAYLTFIVKGHDSIMLSVKAYDPRDLLSGHYLQYAIEYGPAMPCARDGNFGESRFTDCVCFDQSPDGSPATTSWSGDCNARPPYGCPLWVTGTCENGRYEVGIERFYIPEEFSKPLRRVPDNSTIQVHLNGKGNGIVTDFFVAGQPLKVYVESLPAEDEPKS